MRWVAIRGAVLMAALGLAPLSQAVEILRWERLPLSVALQVGQERVVFVDRRVRVGVPAAENHLQGHDAVEPELACLVDDAHAALPEFLQDLVAGHRGAAGSALLLGLDEGADFHQRGEATVQRGSQLAPPGEERLQPRQQARQSAGGRPKPDPSISVMGRSEQRPDEPRSARRNPDGQAVQLLGQHDLASKPRGRLHARRDAE